MSQTTQAITLATPTDCHSCGQIHAPVALAPGEAAYCGRCRGLLARHHAGSLHATAALALAAMVLYVPANLFPILQMQLYGAYSQNTIWSGCVRLYHSGEPGIAVIVFLASIAIPLLKLVGLFFLVTTTAMGWTRWRAPRTWAFRFIEGAGRWAMLDVFALAILVSLMKLRALGTIVPGRGALAFAAVVVLTLLASASFEPRLIWVGDDAQRRQA